MPKLGLLTLNVRGAQESGLFAKLIHEFKSWTQSKGISVMVVQEHNIRPDRQSEIERIAASKGIKCIASFAPANPAGGHTGGVLILLDEKTVTYEDTLVNINGLITIRVDWGGEKKEIGGVYAPSNDLERIDFFNNIRSKITKTR